jgi:hypothetical protein
VKVKEQYPEVIHDWVIFMPLLSSYLLARLLAFLKAAAAAVCKSKSEREENIQKCFAINSRLAAHDKTCIYCQQVKNQLFT